jgi:hypothetical protein
MNKTSPRSKFAGRPAEGGWAYIKQSIVAGQRPVLRKTIWPSRLALGPGGGVEALHDAVDDLAEAVAELVRIDDLLVHYGVRH